MSVIGKILPVIFPGIIKMKVYVSDQLYQKLSFRAGDI